METNEQPNRAEQLQAALKRWTRCTKDFDRASKSGDDDSDAIDALQEEEDAAAQSVRDAAAKVFAQLRSLQQALAALAQETEAAVEALQTLEERAALQRERTSRHGELAEIEFTLQEKKNELTAGLEGVNAAIDTLDEALVSLSS